MTEATTPATVFVANGLTCIELDARRVPALQDFFDRNPEYFHSITGQPPGPDEAFTERHELPPPDMPFRKKWLLGMVDDVGNMQAMANVLSDFLAPRVWHIGLFIVASSLHGTGKSRSIYAELEQWMIANGASWIRLGVVEGNAKAERFWSKVGYMEVRRRAGVEMGARINTVRVMVKALVAGSSVAQYLDIVPRDRPDSR
jgi:GNAT superfamily N-acetyltransferase